MNMKQFFGSIAKPYGIYMRPISTHALTFRGLSDNVRLNRDVKQEAQLSPRDRAMRRVN